MLDRRIGVFLFTLSTFLIWLFFAMYFSDGNRWWTVIKVEQSSYDTFVGSVSTAKVLIGAIIFMGIGLIVYKVIKRG
jgi:hypothetical protein